MNNILKKIFCKLKIVNFKLLFLLIFLFAFIVKKAASPPISSPNTPFLFVCNQMQRDLKTSLLKSLSKAHNEILISVYTLSDPEFIEALNRKADEEASIYVITDKKQVKQLSKLLNPKIKIRLLKQKGLMHHKIFIFDDNCYIGSANLTSQSLRMHDNLLLNLYNPLLSQFLKSQLLHHDNPQGQLVLNGFNFFFLPNDEAFRTVIEHINQAKSSIEIAMFTFTHPQILQALIQAKKRGVAITVIFDYLSYKGASRNMAEALTKAHFNIYHNRGMQLMHHKFALIDKEKFIMGSTNWTQSGFNKNNEILLVCSKLSLENLKFIQKMWKNLLWEAKKITVD